MVARVNMCDGASTDYSVVGLLNSSAHPPAT